MVRFRFKHGLRFIEDGLNWLLNRRTATNKLVFEEENGAAATQTLTESEVYERYLQNKWLVDESSLGIGKNLRYFTTPKDIRALSEKDQKQVARRLSYLMKLRSKFSEVDQEFRLVPLLFKTLIAEIAKELKDPKPPGPTTVWNWWKRFAPTQCATKLADKRKTGRERDAVQYSVFEEVICEVFLKPQKNPGLEVYETIKDRISRINRGLGEATQITAPSRATVYRWLAKLNHLVVLRAREGKEVSERALRGTLQGLRIGKILERYEIDHTPIDVLVVCEKTRMVLGRPWLTLVIDRKSRMIAGFYLSFHAPSAYSVLYAMRMAILPKEELLKSVDGIKNCWPVRGIPRLLATDNGMDLHSNALETFCHDAAMEILYCGVAHPEMKGAIERLFGTLSRSLFHILPGTVFANITQRGDYPSEECAALDINQLTKILVKWIVDQYHCTPHRGLDGKTPLQVWLEDESRTDIDLPAYPRQLDLMVGHCAVRTVFKYGVEYDCVRYNSPVLLAFRDETEESPLVDIRAYEHDISFVDVLDETNGEFIRVPAVDQEYCNGLTRHAHLLVRQEVRKRFGDEWTQTQLFAVKQEIQAMLSDAMKANKAGKRKKSAAVTGVDSNRALETQSAALNRSMQPMPVHSEPNLPSVTTFADVLPLYTSEKVGTTHEIA